MIQADDLQKAYKLLQDQRTSWEPLWEDVTKFALPRRSNWDLESTEGSQVGRAIYNGRAVHALQLEADGLQGYLVSPAFKWFKLKLASEEAMRLPGVADWLEELEEALYSSMNRSRFYEATSEFFTDGLSIGTATMYVGEDLEHNTILFSTRHPKEVYISENAHGYVDTVVRHYLMTNRNIIEEFGEANVDKNVLDAAKSNPYEKAEVIHFVYPRAERLIGPASGDKKGFASVYLDAKNKRIMRESGFDQNPYLCWRARKNSDEVYGRSPASDALSDILRLNQVSKTTLMAGQMAVEPPLNIPASMKGFEQIIPRGYNYFTDPNSVITPIPLGQNYPIGRDVEQSMEELINDHFHVDFFMMLQNAERQMTAREVIERQGEKAAVLGVQISRLNSEFLQPLIDRVIAIEAGRGRIPPPPASLRGYSGELGIELMGPLAQAQKRYHQTQGVSRGLEWIMGMMQVDPGSVDNVDVDELTRQGLTAFGVPQKIIRELPDVLQLRQRRAQAQAEAQQQAIEMEQQKTVAANADKLNVPVNPGSMLNEIQAAAASAMPGSPQVEQ